MQIANSVPSRSSTPVPNRGTTPEAGLGVDINEENVHLRQASSLLVDYVAFRAKLRLLWDNEISTLDHFVAGGKECMGALLFTFTLSSLVTTGHILFSNFATRS